MSYNAKNAFLRCAVLLAALCLPGLNPTGNVAWGQNTGGFASMTGVVQDSSGAVVPGANIVIANMSKGIRRELVSNGAGVFNAPALVPAEGYSVTVTKPGFSTLEIQDIELEVGEQLSLNPLMAVSSAATQVTVTSEAPEIEGTKTDVSTVVDSREVMDLPINGRRVDSFVLLNPGVTNDAGFGLVTFRGNVGGNLFLTDGVDTTNQFYDENAGRTRSYNISQDAIQEFEVVSSNFAAEYGHASGGVINTVTRSGTNSFHGTAYWFFRNRTLNATDAFANGNNPQDWRHQAGLSVGGPIKKDKLFFFFNGELERRYAPIISSNGFSTYFNSTGQYIPGSATNPNCGPPATPAQCTAAIDYLLPRVAPQLVPRTIDNNLLFGKVDYNITDRNRLTAEMNYVDYRSPNGIQTSTALTNGAGVGNNSNTTVFDRTEKLSLTSVLSSNMLNQLQLGIFKDRQFDPLSPSLLPSIGPIALTIGNLGDVGYATSYPRLLPSELRIQVLESFSYTKGKHSMKYGLEYGHLEDYVNQLANRYGSYTYSSLTQFAEDYSGNTTGAKNWTTFTQRFGNPVSDTTLQDISLYAQDQWHVTPKLTITPGLRWERTALPQPPQPNPALPQTDSVPKQPIEFAPRIGIAYAFNDKTVFRAGYGVFYNRYITSTFESLFESNGLYQPNYTLHGATAAQLAAGPVFPGALPVAPNVTGSANLAFADPNYRNSYSEQGTAAVERQLGHRTTLTVSYVWNRGLHIISGFDANLAPPTQSYTYPILNASGTQVGSYTTPLYTQRLNPAFGTVVEVGSNLNSYYNGLVVQVNRRYSGWFEAQANYTWSHSIDYDIGGAAGSTGSSGIVYTPSFPTATITDGNWQADKGSSTVDQRHRLVMNGIFSPKFVKGDSAVDRFLINNWQLSVIETLASSFPEVPYVTTGVLPAGDINTGTSEGLSGLGGSDRVPFNSTSALNIAPTYRTDARITKVLRFSERFQAQLAFEAVNVFNHLILATGSAQARVNEEYFTEKLSSGAIALAPYPLYGTAQSSAAPSMSDGTTARRAQASLRLVF